MFLVGEEEGKSNHAIEVGKVEQVLLSLVILWHGRHGYR